MKWENDMKNRYLIKKILPMNLIRKVRRVYQESRMSEVNRVPIRAYKKSEAKDGINLIGPITAQNGLGQSCRLLARELESLGLPVCLVDSQLTSQVGTEDRSYLEKIIKKPLYGINLIAINPYEIGLLYLKFGRKLWDYRYNIAFWLWELQEVPEDWIGAERFFDEIWTPSLYVSNVFRKYYRIPIFTIPYSVEAPFDVKFDREYFHLPESQKLFLILYDSASTSERKNPFGAIEAYRKAFPFENDNVGLIIKINNANPEDIENLKVKLDGYRNIYYMTETLNKIEVNSLIKSADVFVSLHRAEGFGLVVAEAMLLGTPVITTNWSSTTEFTTEETACLVDYQLIEIQKDSGFYKKGYHWADPDINQASEYMKQMVVNEEFYQEMQQKAYEYALKKFSLEQAVEKIRDRIREVKK